MLAGDGDDQISVTVDSDQSSFLINVNGTEYRYSQSEVDYINVLGRGGDDSITVDLGTENDTVSTHANGLNAVNDKFRISASGFSTVDVSGGGGHDVVSLADSRGQDRLTGRSTAEGYSATLTNGNYRSTVTGFDLAFIASTGGGDTADVVGTSGNDVFVSRGFHNALRVAGTNLVFNHFAEVSVDGGGGEDRANLNDSAGNQHYVLTPRAGTIFSANSTVSVNDFARVNAFATSGNDTVELRDSIRSSSNNDDIFDSRDGVNVLYGDGYQLYASGFDNVEAVSTGGSDIAQIFDTAGNDLLYSRGGDAELVSGNQTVAAKDFRVVNLVANRGGFDRAFVTGSSDTDVVRSNNTVRVVNSEGQTNRIRNAESVNVNLSQVVAQSISTQSLDSLAESFDEAEFETTLQMLQLTNAENANETGGQDADDLEDLDLLESLGDQAKSYMGDGTLSAEDKAVMEARSVDDAIADYSLEAIDYLYALRGQSGKK